MAVDVSDEVTRCDEHGPASKTAPSDEPVTASDALAADGDGSENGGANMMAAVVRRGGDDEAAADRGWLATVTSVMGPEGFATVSLPS